MPFTMNHSIHGRRLGLSTTGGLVSAAGSTGRGSTIFGLAFQQWGDDMVQTVSTGGALINNFGLTIVSSDSTSGMAALEMAAPVAGVHKEIYFLGSATALTLDTTATTITFLTSGSSLTGISGSTTLSIDGDLTRLEIGGQALILRGLSTTQWQVASKTVGIST